VVISTGELVYSTVLFAQLRYYLDYGWIKVGVFVAKMNLGSAKMEKGRGASEGKLKSEEIVHGDRRYILDLKENHRGRFLKVEN
jgi:PurA ssDNA and RNA-binding protein